ncbi:MAG: helicase-associated domain-containing protein [Actinobacteria bacterium]|nr:helicase-associated domain-containing protein [Actinomycetota bacterium]MCB8997452.1 helicase-associated domain-containing protein [Actinomycetota bacterium]
MASSALPRSLADDLRSRSAGQIVRLLRLRPDLLQPWPADLGQLARRASDDASVLEAMQSLTTPELRVLAVFACLHEAGLDQLAQALPDDTDLERTVGSLWARALLWGGPDTYRIARAAQQSFGPYPCGLVAQSHTAADAQAVRDAADLVAADQLRDWVWHNPVSTQPHPLLIQRGEQYVLSREASLVLREGAYLPPVQAPASAEPAEPARGHSLWAVLAGVRYLLTDLTRQDLPSHAVRGVSRRGAADRAEQMKVPVDDLLVWLELAAAAGLVGLHEGSCRPTPAARAWLAGDAEQMWTALMTAWLRSDRLLGDCLPEMLGSLTSTVQPRTALHRLHILSVWPPAGRLDVDQLRELVAWERPRMHEAVEQVPGVYRELLALGLIEAGTPTAAMAELPEAVRAAARCLPEAQADGLIVQPDGTVIAPLGIDNPTWQLLQSIAHVESWGPVVMHRIDPARLRSTVGGRDPHEVLGALTSASKTPIPQSLEYAVHDASRSSGVRVYPATVVEGGAAEAEQLVRLGLTQVSDRVFTSAQRPDEVVRLLQTAGVATTEGPEQVFATALERAVSEAAPDDAAVARLVEHLLDAQPVPDAVPPELHPADPQTVADVCRQAIAEDRRVWVRYAQDDGVRTELVEPIDLRVGRLSGWSLNAARMITVPLARIAAVGGDDD